jgi:hypothetical protein
LPGDIFQSPIFLAGQFSVPNELHDSRASRFGDRLRAACAPRINDHDFLRERNAGQTIMQVRRFVLNRDKH